MKVEGETETNTTKVIGRHKEVARGGSTRWTDIGQPTNTPVRGRHAMPRAERSRKKTNTRETHQGNKHKGATFKGNMRVKHKESSKEVHTRWEHKGGTERENMHSKPLMGSIRAEESRKHKC